MRQVFRTSCLTLITTEPSEAALWQRMEEQDDGRIATEADHLFDTSYAWAA